MEGIRWGYGGEMVGRWWGPVADTGQGGRVDGFPSVNVKGLGPTRTPEGDHMRLACAAPRPRGAEPCGTLHRRTVRSQTDAEANGETPLAARETRALPMPNEQLRLRSVPDNARPGAFDAAEVAREFQELRCGRIGAGGLATRVEVKAAHFI
jgi:hypothetical protein